MGLKETDTDLVVFLVEKHLELAKIAFRFDTQDFGTVQQFASWCDSSIKLEYLYLLTLADIWAVNLEDESTANLTNQPTQSEFAAWSADGSKIAFIADRDGNTEVYVMDADGSHQTRLTFTDARESAPAWSPH